jgi:hypothetical protein
MPTASRDYRKNVFLNCPFDDLYRPAFLTIQFTVAACGFRLRCALEVQDAGETRIDKIVRIIQDCRLGIHDISRTEADPVSHLPRFNMPFELGLFLGAKYFGEQHQSQKACIILDVQRFRFQQFLSDIAGQDPVAYVSGDERSLIQTIRDWLRTHSRKRQLPGPVKILQAYQSFRNDRPDILQQLGLDDRSVSYIDEQGIVANWLVRSPLT